MNAKTVNVEIPRSFEQTLSRTAKVSWLNRVRHNDEKYLVMRFDGKQITQTKMSREEKDKLKPTSVDLHLDLAVGEIFLKHESIPPRSGQRGKPKHPKGPGWRDLKIGYQIITLLLDIMKTGPNLYRLESPNYMQARLSRLRRYLGEKPSKNYNPILDVRSVPDYTAKCKCTWQLIELLSEVQSPEESQLA